jgi:hypothetical protein
MAIHNTPLILFQTQCVVGRPCSKMLKNNMTLKGNLGNIDVLDFCPFKSGFFLIQFQRSFNIFAGKLFPYGLLIMAVVPLISQILIKNK